MPLDGLRAWIGEVERKLGMRTRVFLALGAIAIGAAGAATYLALDTRDDAVGESDVQALQEDLEAQIGAGGATDSADLARLEAELNALEAEVRQLRGKEGASNRGAAGPGGIGTGDDAAGADALGADGAGAADASDAGTGDAGSAETGQTEDADTAGTDTPGGGVAETGGADELPDVLPDAQENAE